MRNPDGATPSRLAVLIAAHREEIVTRLAELEWAADPVNPHRLVAGAEAVRPRVTLFVDLLIGGTGTGDWTAFDKVIGESTIELLARGMITPEELDERALTIAGVLIPVVYEAPEGLASMTALFGIMHSLGNRILAGYNRRLVDDLRRVDEVKTMFLRVTTHELRAPLGTVGGYSSMLLAGDLGELPSPARAGVEAIVRAASSTRSLLDRLVEAARLESGGEILSRTPQLLSEIVTVAVDPLREAARFKEVEITEEVGEGQTDVDLQEMAIAVRNLVGNALKYASDGGEVKIRAATEADGVIFEVSDKGQGIQPDELPLLFDRYYRSPSSRASGIDGSGLGLYIVKRIAQLHGGDATAESRPGHGSTFRISIPSTSEARPGA